MKPKNALGVVFAAIVLCVAGLFLKAWILGIILSWFSVSLTIWQNLLIIILADLITGNFKISSK
jgi:hypothetical protein